MKLLADENIPLASVRNLRGLGHDVISIAERSPGSSVKVSTCAAVSQPRIDAGYGRRCLSAIAEPLQSSEGE